MFDTFSCRKFAYFDTALNQSCRVVNDDSMGLGPVAVRCFVSKRHAFKCISSRMRKFENVFRFSPSRDGILPVFSWSGILLGSM